MNQSLDEAGPILRAGERAPSPLRVSMRRSVMDGAAFTLMMGLAEMYLPALVLSLAFSEVTAGLIVALPPAVGAMLQLAAPSLIRLTGSPKRWVVLCCGVQAASLVPMAVAAAAGAIPAWAMFAVACLYFTSGMLAGSAWTTWIGAVVPRRLHARWFGLRMRVLNIGLLGGFVLGGCALTIATGGEAGAAPAAVRYTFAAMLMLAAGARAFSTWELSRQIEPAQWPAEARVKPTAFLARALGVGGAGRSGALGVRLLIFMFAARFAENLAAPYVNPYLLKHLEQPYQMYTLLAAAVVAGKIVSLAVLGGLAHRLGPRTVLWVSAVAIVPVGWMWLLSSADGWIGFVQLWSGAAWAGFELATWLLILRLIRSEERTSVMSLFYVGNWGAIALGSIAGGWVLDSFGHDADAYAWCFHLSSAARLGALLVLWWAVGIGRRREATWPRGAASRAGDPADTAERRIDDDK